MRMRRGNLLLGTAGAIVAAIAGAVIWAAITATINFQIGYMAIGVGFLAGYAMRTLSGSRERVEGIVAGVVALLGCLLGNLLAIVVTVAQHDHYPLMETLLNVGLHPLVAGELLRLGFDLMDLVFYAIAVYAAYRAALAPVRRTVAATSAPPATPPRTTPLAATTVPTVAEAAPSATEPPNV